MKTIKASHYVASSGYEFSDYYIKNANNINTLYEREALGTWLIN